ncbi:MAG: hypothetical protein LKJ88_03105 [Bacilli bacterium]|jgi:hypothetical protein|nr:hypothetical protein [Bacilli bacterium]
MKIKRLTGVLLATLFALVSCQSGSSSVASEAISSSNGGSSDVNKSSELSSEVSSSIVSSQTQSSSEISSAVSSESSSIISSSSNSSLPEVSGKEALNQLKSSPFKSNISSSSSLGLSSLAECGIDEIKFNEEEKYPVPSEGTIYRVEDYGLSPDNDLNSPKLNTLLASLKDVAGTKIVKIPSGTYLFSNTLNFDGLKDVYLVGEKDTLLLFIGWGTYISAKNSSNIHFNSLKFDMKYSPTVEGTISSFDESVSGSPVIVLDIPSEFDLTNDNYASWLNSPGRGSYMECYFDEPSQTYVPDTSANLFYNSTGSQSQKGITKASYNSASHQLSVTLSTDFPYWTYRTPSKGKHVSMAFTMYENSGFYFLDDQDVYFEHIEVATTGGMGFRAERGKDFHLNHVRFAPFASSSRIMTCTADIIHTINLEGKLDITNSLLQGSHDDALNIKQFYGKVTSVTASAKEIDVGQTQSEVTAKYEIGDKLDLYQMSDMALMDSFTVTDVTKSGTNYYLTVDHRPSSDLVGCLVGNDTKSTHMNLDNSLIQSKRNRGILFQTRYSSITNCCFRNVVMGAIQILGIYDVFGEGILPTNITLSGNKFIKNSGDISIFTYGSSSTASSCSIHDIQINNNFFYDTMDQSSNVLGGRNVSFNNNLFYFDRKAASPFIRINQTIDSDFSNNLGVFSGVPIIGIVFLAQDTGVSGITATNNLFKEDTEL